MASTAQEALPADMPGHAREAMRCSGPGSGQIARALVADRTDTLCARRRGAARHTHAQVPLGVAPHPHWRKAPAGLAENDESHRQ